MPDEQPVYIANYTVTMTFDQRADTLQKVRTFIKAKQPEIQRRIDTEIKFKCDMALSITAAGIVAML